MCKSAGGKSRVYEVVRSSSGNRILALVDGAAFGCEIGKIYRYLIMSGRDCVIYAP